MPTPDAFRRARPARSRRLPLVAGAAAAAVLALTGCGGDTETVVRTVTVPVGGNVGAGTSTAPAASTPTAPVDAQQPSTPGASQPALPGGRPAIDGRYLMAVDDYSPAQITIGGDGGLAEDIPWTAQTTCDAAGACELRIRRGLEGGGSKNLTLRPDGDDDRTWTGETTGISACGGEDTPPAPYRISVRATKVEDVGGRPTATELISYFRASRVRDCDFSESKMRTTFKGSLDR